MLSVFNSSLAKLVEGPVSWFMGHDGFNIILVADVIQKYSSKIKHYSDTQTQILP